MRRRDAVAGVVMAALGTAPVTIAAPVPAACPEIASTTHPDDFAACLLARARHEPLAAACCYPEGY